MLLKKIKNKTGNLTQHQSISHTSKLQLPLLEKLLSVNSYYFFWFVFFAFFYVIKVYVKLP